jgi:histidine triad (HIT) family protein
MMGPEGDLGNLGHAASNSPNSRACIFCKIALGELAAAVVFEDEQSLAFLDHRPLFPGHCLLIPRAHHETLIDVPASLIPGLFMNARLLAGAVERGLGADGVFVGINNRVSQSVPHFHIHVVPRRRKDGLRGFFWPRQRYSTESIQQVQEALRAAVAELQADSGG